MVDLRTAAEEYIDKQLAIVAPLGVSVLKREELIRSAMGVVDGDDTRAVGAASRYLSDLRTRNLVCRFWYKVASIELFAMRMKAAIHAFKTIGGRQYLEGWEHLTTFKGVLEPTATGFSGYVEGVPGLGVAAETAEECATLLGEAFALHREGYVVTRKPYMLLTVNASLASMVSI